MSMTKKAMNQRDNMIFRLLSITESKGISFNFFEMRDIIDRLHRYESTLHTIAERYCNEEMNEIEMARLERKESNTQKKVIELLKTIGVGENKVEFSGDPRGCIISMKLYDEYPYDEYCINW